MNIKKYKTTKEVAEALGLTDPKFFNANHPIFSGKAGEVFKASEAVESVKDFSEDFAGNLIGSMQELIKPVVLFNVLGNARNYNYTRGVQKNPEEIEKTMAILTEEVGELKEALTTNNLAEIVDALCDIMYVTLGIAVKSGVAFETCLSFPLVCYNNLFKLKEDKEGLLYADIVNGKIQKPTGFESLDLSKIIPTLKGGDNA